MLTVAQSSLASGLLLPESVLHSEWFAVLAAFVGINTVMYAAMAVAHILPKSYLSDWVTSGNRRSETRSIYPQEGVGETPDHHIEVSASVNDPGSERSRCWTERMTRTSRSTSSRTLPAIRSAIFVA